MRKLRVVLADDHQVMREGLRLLVNSQTDMEVVGEVGDGAAAVVLTNVLQPDVVIMDISMPIVGGLCAIEKLRQGGSRAKVLVLTRHAERGFVQQMLRAGADGYVLKRSASDELVRAISHVAAGELYLDPSITDEVIDDHALRRRGREAPPASLSRREEEILRLLASGLSSREVGARLRISAKTVDTHKKSAMRKLGINSRIELVRYAALRGWLQDL